MRLSFLSVFRHCAVCEHPVVEQWSLCNLCLGGLFRCAGEELHSQQLACGIWHTWWQTWRGDDDVTSAVVRGLKVGLSAQETRCLAMEFLSQAQPNLIPGATIFYPQKKGVGRDAARALAESLAGILGWPAQSLEIRGHGKQSRRGLEERKKIQFVSTRPPSGPVVFVDDIVTSGSTGLSAYRALDQPVNFAIWSLFFRPAL